MLIKELNHLNEHEMAQVRDLVAQCNKYDGLKGFIDVDHSINFNKDMNSVFMLYEDKKLVSILTLFAPGSKEAEVSAMTLPAYRSRGYFTELVKRATQEVKKYGVPELLFLCEEASSTGKVVLAKQKAEYEFTEYLLIYNHSRDKEILQQDYNIRLVEATWSDLESVIEISQIVFEDSYEGAKSIIENILKSENRKLFLGQINGQHIGMGSYSLSSGSASINGLGVLPEHQGKGYGREMLYSIMKKLLELKVKQIGIEVNSENANAYQLYRKSGFDVENAWQYYRKAIE